MKPRFRLALLSILVVSGCSGSKAPMSPVCTEEFRPGLVVYVKDALTNGGVASGASLIAREGIFKDSVAFESSRSDLNNLPLVAAGERSGTYLVTVSKPGYSMWSRSNVRVTSNQCHVNTVTLTALLQPSASLAADIGR